MWPKNTLPGAVLLQDAAEGDNDEVAYGTGKAGSMYEDVEDIGCMADGKVVVENMDIEDVEVWEAWAQSEGEQLHLVEGIVDMEDQIVVVPVEDLELVGSETLVKECVHVVQSMLEL